MLRKYFGTDGIRGKANTGNITPIMMIKLAMASSVAGNIMNQNKTVLIGRDTRISGQMLESALISGFISVGINVMLIDIIPTPAISILVKKMNADMGIMISASHNPYLDNGLKFFDSKGYKISSELEAKIESLLNSDMSEFMTLKLGKIIKLTEAKDIYINQLKSESNLKSLSGIKIAIDCANGAAYDIAPRIFKELGAEIISYADKPNGFNINDQCGATYASNLSNLVRNSNADIGIALDGDADRVTIVDEKGVIIDGDQILALIAKYLLKDGYVVGTVLTNTGLESYLHSLGIKLLRSDVGDKNVVNMMKKNHCILGGEPSGHIMIGDTTSDGIKIALIILKIYLEKSILISELLSKFKPIPKISTNINYECDRDILSNHITTVQNKFQEKYKDSRILVRMSGTENMVRILVENENHIIAKDVSREISRDITRLIKSID